LIAELDHGQGIAIQAIELRKTYREGWLRRKQFQALNGVSFQVPAGCVFGLLGPNGAGKTTFVKVLMGIIRQTEGTARVFGLPAGGRQARKLIGYLPERLALPTYLTGHQALEYCGGLSGLSARQVRDRREGLLSMVGLEGWGTTRIAKYSKGMIQRLGLAQAMLHQPRVLVLDEPTDGLDPKARAGVREILLRLSRQGVTVFLNSHLLQEVELLCQQVAILSEGNVKYCGSVADIHDYLNQQRGGNKKLQVTFTVRGPAAAMQSLVIAADADQDESGSLGRGFQAASVRSIDDQQWSITERLEDQVAVDRRVDLLRGAGLSLCSLTPERISLEAAFLELVGHGAEALETQVAQAKQGLVQAGRRGSDG